ncbi:hypothetical protein BUALT_Bualt11G0099400 [Buddleja alternifolia]|uniref:LysM domain-containing protein n=1 Tax=Buddleja alternifolia TaxID=168488 RepID=A0AAV6WYN4_9LAMI|nr:hypothetical protein BUALT_Bualt11G0099400 [Buddleja alternifolia]
MKAKSSTSSTETISWYIATLLLALLLVFSWCRFVCCRCDSYDSLRDFTTTTYDHMENKRDTERPCDEYYVVGEGETLHSIMHKCKDPYIVEENPHIHHADEIFPGLVIKLYA